MKPAMREFLVELQTLLEKHNTTIDAVGRYIPYQDEQGHQIEFFCKGYMATNIEEITEGELEIILEEG